MADAKGFAEALGRFGTDTIDEMSVDAVRRFAGRSGELLVQNSPVSMRSHPHRGAFKGAWRLVIGFPWRVDGGTPDPGGDETIARMRSVLSAAPTRVDEWGRIFISNGNKRAESIELAHRVLARSVAQAIQEVE